MRLDMKPPRTARRTEFIIAVNNSPPRCEDIISVTSTFHMSMESSFETQFKVVLLKTDPESTFPDLHSLNFPMREATALSVTDTT